MRALANTIPWDVGRRYSPGHHCLRYIGDCSGMHYGQAMSTSHPHLIRSGEVTPGVMAGEYSRRRQALVTSLTKAARPNAEHYLVAIASGKQLFSAPDVPCEFRQCADFRYLSGFLEAKSVLLMEWSKSETSCRTTLFACGRSEKDRLWHGPKVSLSELPGVFSVDQALELDTLPTYLSRYYPAKAISDCKLWYNNSSVVDENLLDTIRTHFSKSFKTFNVLPQLHMHRVVKTPVEIDIMKKASQATHEGFLSMFEACASRNQSIPEWTLHSRFMSGVMTSKAISPPNRSTLAFPTVVAGGCRATVLHYIAKDMFVRSGELVLVDAGAEVDGYVCDQSRTWPVSGQFTSCQSIVYNAVLDVQKMCLSAIDAAASQNAPLSLTQVHTMALLKMEDLLCSIGVIPASVCTTDRARVTRLFFPHSIGHYVGGDVHDCKMAPESTPFKPGMTFTIEPGIYIAPDTAPAWVPSCFHGIGIRVEDIVVIGTDGKSQLLTTTVKSMEELERQLRSD